MSVSNYSMASLFESEEESANEEYIPAHIEFDVVEVDKEDVKEESEKQAAGSDDINNDEFAFPLFAFGGGSAENKQQVMKISLKEKEIEEIKLERPEAYYLARYDEKQRLQFAETAISYEDIISASVVLRDWQPWKVMDLKEYNRQFDPLQRNKKRPGKKKRQNKIESRKRKEEKKKVIKKLEREKEKLLKKKMFHKRGGKKHKKTKEPKKPTYRTE